MRKTLIENMIVIDDSDSVEYKIDDNNLNRLMFDFSVPETVRLECFNRSVIKEPDNVPELINRFGIGYQISRTTLIKSFLIKLGENQLLTPFQRSLAIQALLMNDENDPVAFRLINNCLLYDLPAVYRIDLIRILMNAVEYKQQATTYLEQFISDDKLSCSYRYKIILSLKDKKIAFLYAGLKKFISNDKNDLYYRILGCQYLLSEKQEQRVCEEFLVSIVSDEQNPYNQRADACDILLQYAQGDVKLLAQKYILQLGKVDRHSYNLYDNAQNVHNVEIEKSVVECIEYIASFDLMKHNNESITFEFVEQSILNINKNDNIVVSLNRIALDRAVYGQVQITLQQILLKIWSFVSSHKDEAVLKQRLIEELNDMAGTCSSGFASRLVNTLSGFIDVSLRISWSDQITANLSGRLNALIRELDDLDQQEKILEQMTNENISDKTALLEFLTKNISAIQGQMFQEFTKHISPEDFDLHFKRALMVYENGNYI